MLPVLYLRGLSTGDFRDGLAALLGENAAELSPGAITRLTSSSPIQSTFATVRPRQRVTKAPVRGSRPRDGLPAAAARAIVAAP